MAAIATAVASIIKAGGHVVAPNGVYHVLKDVPGERFLIAVVADSGG